LTFFQRIKTPFTESPAAEQAQAQPRMRLVGELLQERREDLGLELDEIGAMLRIKPLYLAALEQGRTHDLPGPTYAIGFVRAYSDFLGLDAEAVLARFKTEVAGVTARPDLTLPVPLGERSLPGGALVLVALIVALCGYGIWYYISTEARNRPERVAAVPAALDKPLAPAVAPSAQPTPPVAQPAAVSGSPPPVAQPSAAQAAAPQGTAQASPQSAPGVNLAPGALITTMPRNASPSVPAPAAPPQQQAQQAAPPASTTVAPPASTTAASPASAQQPAPVQQAAPAQQTASAPPPAPQTASVTAVPSVSPSSTPATSGAGGKITIKAVADCWIQVRATDQSIVFSRVLKAGETYAVPQRAGLSLRTGNAGALEVAVDGKTAPSIGGIGALRRDVELDPTELAAGTAVHG
jgi:cytoskeleton protein RodZ